MTRTPRPLYSFLQPSHAVTNEHVANSERQVSLKAAVALPYLQEALPLPQRRCQEPQASLSNRILPGPGWSGHQAGGDGMISAAPADELS